MAVLKVSDYIVEFFINKGVTDVFGYPGGMVTHLMDSFDKYKNQICAHVNYHEQASSFAACGYAMASGKLGVAYATSGPGVTNLMTGIANAFFDSIPLILITGQVNTYEGKGNLQIRQKGFQEMEVISIAAPITKYSTYVNSAEKIPYELEKAYHISMNGRKGPVLLDIPMDILRTEIDLEACEKYIGNRDFNSKKLDEFAEILTNEISRARKPVLLVGSGVRYSGSLKDFRELANNWEIPIVTSMIAVDAVPSDDELNFGFIGAYGHRYANFIISKCDLIVSFGSRLDCRQTGNDKRLFAENAKLIRIEIDKNELENKIKENEIQLNCDIAKLLPLLKRKNHIQHPSELLEECKLYKDKLASIDEGEGNRVVKKISDNIDNDIIICTDVGQNQVWVAQSFRIKDKQQVLFSGGHGSMGFSLPSAIGAYYGSGKKVVSVNGDGGFQMNLQELQLISREQIPLKIIILNNKSLGMIRHFQEMYFDNNYCQTIEGNGYTSPDFAKIAEAYGIKSINFNLTSDWELIRKELAGNAPTVIVINLSNLTYVFPKLAMGKPIYDQEPSIERKLLQELLEWNRE